MYLKFEIIQLVYRRFYTKMIKYNQFYLKTTIRLRGLKGMNINDILSDDLSSELLKRYIDYYFYDMIRISKDKDVYYQKKDNMYISIMKDEIDRKIKGSGKLREKPWSNFLFFFIDKDKFINCFGTNGNHRDILSIDNDNNIILSDFVINNSIKNNQAIYLNRKNNYKLSKCLFDKIKKNYSYLFVRSYVYITIILVDESASTNKTDYLTYYFNTNYKFTETNGKTNFIANVINSYLVDDIQIELDNMRDANRDVFDCVRAYNNNLDYTPLTSYNLDNIVNSINEGTEYLAVDGCARTGKTIIAMSLLRLYPASNLLLMNYYFYKALKDAFAALNINFPDNRIFHQAYGKKGYYDGIKSINFDFSIIDECQRLGEKYNLVNRMIISSSHKHSIFLGDNLQKLRADTDGGISYIKKILIENGKVLTLFKFTSSIGVPPEILKNIKYLLGDPTVIKPHLIGEYNIKIYDDKSKFLNDYKNDCHEKRHIATIHEPCKNFSNIDSFRAFPKEFINSDYPYFLNKEIINKYYLSPYELISREVETIYVYIRNAVNPDNLEGFVFNHLYILMTRGTISLNIYCENNELKYYFHKRLKNITDYSASIEKNVDECVKDGQFEIDEGIIEEFNNKYNIQSPIEQIKNRNITRLVHFTEEKNIPSIIKNGLLPRSSLEKKGEFFDYNDKNRYDGRKDAVCLSVENPNQRLLEKFKRDYPDKKYKLITINPSILYTSFINSDCVKLTPRVYCNYNAAARSTLTDPNDIDIMFSSKVQTYHWQYGIIDHSRGNLPACQPTMSQAEILFCGRIPPEYIEFIDDIGE